MFFPENSRVVKENYVQIMNNELEVFDNRKSGFSLLIKAYGKKILFDFGISDEVKKNLKKIGLDYHDIDYFVMSHGHIDHSEGIKYIKNTEKKKLICHPDALEGKFYGNLNIGCPIGKREIYDQFNVKFSEKPYWIIDDSVVFLGAIPRKYPVSKEDFPGEKTNGDIDYCKDDSALAIKTGNGILLVTGCSHSGIENIIEYIENLFPGEKVSGIIGGMHILNRRRLDEVLSFLKNKGINDIIPIHCFSQIAIDEFNKHGKTLEKFYFDGKNDSLNE